MKAQPTACTLISCVHQSSPQGIRCVVVILKNIQTPGKIAHAEFTRGRAIPDTRDRQNRGHGKTVDRHVICAKWVI